MTTKNQTILIIGAGLCGSLLAIRMAQRGYHVQLIEKRPDLRKHDIGAGRSINLAFSDRGMKGMKLVGLEEKVKQLCIPMYGRMIHDLEGNTFLSRYSGREKEYINSISRTGLNGLLLDEAETMDNITMIFNHSCKKVNLEEGTVVFIDEENQREVLLKGDVVIGTDGAGSVLRQSMYLNKKFLFSFSQNFLTHGYKELSFPPATDGGFLTEKGALHIWPRGENMLIALPNLDGSFTVTLFLAWDGGEYNFNNLTTPERVTEYFEKFYPDALQLMPHLATEFFENPTGALGTVKCYPWSSYGKTLLMGDAAHAIVPFYGQGMNASFEDVVVFDEILNKHEGDWQKVFTEYEKVRKKDTDAIADLALDNFHEMKSHTASALFQEKRKLETAFEKEFPMEYSSKYSLVTFNEEIPYAEAMRRGRAQDKAILNLLANGKINLDEPLSNTLTLVKRETERILIDESITNQLL